MKQEYREISQELLRVAYAAAYSMENMEAHGAAGRNVEYVGSCIQGNLVYDYYRDSAGDWWFGNRGLVDGQIVSMDILIFGREIKKERAGRWNRNI